MSSTVIKKYSVLSLQLQLQPNLPTNVCNVNPCLACLTCRQYHVQTIGRLNHGTHKAMFLPGPEGQSVFLRLRRTVFGLLFSCTLGFYSSHVMFMSAVFTEAWLDLETILLWYCIVISSFFINVKKTVGLERISCCKSSFLHLLTSFLGNTSWLLAIPELLKFPSKYCSLLPISSPNAHLSFSPLINSLHAA